MIEEEIARRRHGLVPSQDEHAAEPIRAGCGRGLPAVVRLHGAEPHERVRACRSASPMRDEDPARSRRVTDALLKMVTLDVAALERAYRS